MEILLRWGAQEFIGAGVQTRQSILSLRNKRHSHQKKWQRTFNICHASATWNDTNRDHFEQVSNKSTSKRFHKLKLCITFTQNNDAVTGCYQNKRKVKKKTIRVEYIIGADGARSVDSILGIPLEGATYQTGYSTCLIAKWLRQREKMMGGVCRYLDKTFNAFPFDRWDVMANYWRHFYLKNCRVKINYIWQRFKAFQAGDHSGSAQWWISILSFTHHHCVKHFQMGRAFLAGTPHANILRLRLRKAWIPDYKILIILPGNWLLFTRKKAKPAFELPQGVYAFARGSLKHHGRI